MIPFGTHTVTMYHRTRITGEDGRSREEWRRVVMEGCSWRQTSGQVMAEGAVLRKPQISCRIPARYVCPAVGDVLILGKVSEDPVSGKGIAQLLEQHRDSGAFRASVIGSYALPGSPLPHHMARGE